jgi:hypothetical protein
MSLEPNVNLLQQSLGGVFHTFQVHSHKIFKTLRGTLHDVGGGDLQKEESICTLNMIVVCMPTCIEDCCHFFLSVESR